MKPTIPDPFASQPVNTFVIRLWREWSLGAPQWRGRVEHLQTGETAVFQNWEQLLAFLIRQDQIRK